jgi:aminoglycoside phosphotransferase (APT) family kinase protein
VGEVETRELPAVDAVHERLAARIPSRAGDDRPRRHRLDNMILTPGPVAAVVDWELCTLGDRSPTSAC